MLTYNTNDLYHERKTLFFALRSVLVKKYDLKKIWKKIEK